MTQRAKRRAKQRRKAERRSPYLTTQDSDLTTLLRPIIEELRANIVRAFSSIRLDAQPMFSYPVGDGWRSAFSSSQFENFEVLAREAAEQQQQIQDAISQICEALLSNPRTPKWVEEICSEGYTEPFFQEGCWWAFPPGGVMAVELERPKGKGLFDLLPRASEVERLEALPPLSNPNHSPQETLYSDPFGEDCIPLAGFNHPPFNCRCTVDGNTLVIQYTTEPVLERIDVDIPLE